MTAESQVRGPAGQRVRDLLLAGCVTWLLLQNSLLVVWLSGSHFTTAMVVVRALTRVGLHVLGQLWMIPAAALIGVALALSSAAHESADRHRREVSHA